ncbi:MAG: ATP-binding protein [Firmicutes bacterium]|nr:ATP-binding protein [Bacillota bacterium]
MRPDQGFNRLKDSYLFVHLTYCILTVACLTSWLKEADLRFFYNYNFLWIICMVAILALLPAQHRILTQTFMRDYRCLHLYKILYTAVICLIYIPITASVFTSVGLSILTGVPVILAAIVCGTVYGGATALVMSLTISYARAGAVGFTATFLTEQILLLALLVTTAWFIGQSFAYLINLYQQLLSNERYLRKILNSLGIATLHVNSAGGVTHANRSFQALTGLEIAADANIKDLAPKYLPFLNPLLGNLTGGTVEAQPIFGQLTNSLGQLIPVQCIIYPVRGGLEKRHEAVVCLHDISLSQRLEKEKIISNYFIDFLNAGVIVTDAAQKIIEINRQTEQLLGKPRAEILNQNLTDLLTALHEMHGSQPPQELQPNCEIQLGESVLLFNYAELCDTRDCSIGAICIINDITEHKETERKMRRSATLSAIGELAAGTAHEIKNPLTALKGFLQLIQEKKDRQVGEMESYFQVMLSEVDRLNAIVLEFLKLARPEKMETQPVDLNNILDSIWDLLHNEALMRGVELSRSLEPELPPIMGNIDLIKQIIINLGNNAIQAVGPKGAVQLHTLRYKDKVRLSVLDNGPGIEKHLQEKIFDPYFTTKSEGTGLGLAITSKIIHDHNGAINLHSAPGQGAKFDVDFPLAMETPLPNQMAMIDIC